MFDRKAYLREWGIRNREKRNAQSRERHRRNPSARRRDQVRFSVTKKGKYLHLKRASYVRKLEFSMTFDEYVEITKNETCSFCKGSLPRIGYGIDRLDNKRGYVYENCVPCCIKCNRLKGRIEGLGFSFPRTLELMKELTAN